MVAVISENKKFITIAELKELGYTYYKIGRLEEGGELKRINRSTYENLSYTGDENDFFSAEAFAPEGVIGFMSMPGTSAARRRSGHIWRR